MCRTNKIAGQETENVSDKMIGCLCWFGFRHTIGHDKIGFLKIITEIKENKKRYYSNEFGETFDRCRPVKPDEVKFYNHIGDDNEKVELVQKMHILENRIAELEATNKELSEQLFSCGRDWFLAQRELDILRSK